MTEVERMDPGQLVGLGDEPEPEQIEVSHEELEWAADLVELLEDWQNVTGRLLNLYDSTRLRCYAVQVSEYLRQIMRGRVSVDDELQPRAVAELAELLDASLCRRGAVTPQILEMQELLRQVSRRGLRPD